MRRFKAAIKDFYEGSDKLLILLCAVTSLFGALMVTSATRFELSEGYFSRDALVMLIAIAVGTVIALVISFVDSDWIAKMWPLIGVFCILLMVVTLVFGVAPDARPDSRCWLQLDGFYFQSSELVKVGFIITFAMHIELVKDNINKIKNVILLGIHALVPTLLVIKSGDMGSALIFLLIAVGMLFFAGLHRGYFAAGIAGVAAISPLVWMYVFSDYQKDRFLCLIRPEDYPTEIYQQQNGMAALGSGGLTGEGLFKGSFTQNGVVPEAENDMIFTVIGEELGFIGCIAAILLLCFIVIRIGWDGKNARDFGTQLMCCGVAVMIASQMLINIGMCLMIMPVIGITLPFFSAGGSSTLCLYAAIGLVLSIYRSNYARAAVNFRVRNFMTPFSEN